MHKGLVSESYTVALPEWSCCLPHLTDPLAVSWGCHSHIWAPHSQIKPFSDGSPAKADTLSSFSETGMPTRGSLSCAAAAGRPSTEKDGNKEEKIKHCLETDFRLILLISTHVDSLNITTFTQRLLKSKIYEKVSFSHWRPPHSTLLWSNFHIFFLYNAQKGPSSFQGSMSRIYCAW